MSNTPNMSYCMFENTESALEQCVDAMSEASTMECLDMNEHERSAFLRMRNLCRDFLAFHEEILNNTNEQLSERE
jgi:hypothetical protein